MIYMLLSSNDTSGSGAETTATAIQANINTALTSINLGSNLIGDAGFIHLSHALASRTCMKNTELDNKKFGAAGMQKLALVLGAHPSLASIKLCRNTTVNIATQYIAEALVTNNVLVN